MNPKKPLLSICIPTYNRCEYLKKSIESIISQKEFSDEDVEIVISDNCSTDDTRMICKQYEDKYKNFHYYKNEVNIKDKNFPTVIGKANGVYRKLCNDTLLFNSNALFNIVKTVKENLEEKPVLFFINNNTDNKYFNSLSEFLKIVSFNITWIGAFGVWEDFCDGIENNYEGCSESLWQVPFMLNYIAQKRKGIVIGESFCQTQKVEKKNISYGLYKVFYVNFLSFINQSVENGQIPQKTYDRIEKDLLLNFFPSWIYSFEKQDKTLDYSKEEDLKNCICTAYKGKWYFGLFKIKYAVLKFEIFIKGKIRKILKYGI